MACDLTFPLRLPAASVVAAARRPLEGRGGALSGDAAGGEFVLPLAIGTLKGRYEASEGSLRLLVSEKPWWLSCARIHSVMSELLTQARSADAT